MFTVDVDRAAVELTYARLMQFKSVVRRTCLHRMGTGGTKLALQAVRAGRIPVVTGLLQKSLRRKIKVYTASATVFGIVGSDTAVKQQATQYMDYRTGAMRRWKAGQPKRGPKVARPSKYFHLAGKNRRNTTIQDTLAAIRPQLDALMLQILTEEVLSRS